MEAAAGGILGVGERAELEHFAAIGALFEESAARSITIYNLMVARLRASAD